MASEMPRLDSGGSPGSRPRGRNALEALGVRAHPQQPRDFAGAGSHSMQSNEILSRCMLILLRLAPRRPSRVTHRAANSWVLVSDMIAVGLEPDDDEVERSEHAVDRVRR